MRDRLVRLVPGAFTFNIAGYECSRVGGSPASLARLLQRLSNQLRKSDGNDGEKSFWQHLFFDYLHYGSAICWLAYGRRVTLEDIHRFIVTCPSSNEQVAHPSFEKTPWHSTLKLAESKVETKADEVLLTKAAEFFISIQTGLGSKARSAGVQECSGILGKFLLPPFAETFCVAESTFTPDMPLKGTYFVIDAPILVHGDAGRLCQSVITLMTIEAALRQSRPTHHTLIVRDEYQLLATDPLFETLAHSVARSHQLSFWSSVQNLPLLYSCFGGTSKAENEARSLIANYGTKCILANDCMDVTNHFFSSMFGQHKEKFFSFNQQQPNDPVDGFDAVFGSQQFQFGASESFAPRVPEDYFLRLRKGGPPHFLVDFYMAVAGSVFADTGLPYKLMTVSQR